MHCWEDFSGIQEAGCFPFGAVVTGHDGVLPSLNESVYGHMQLPFCNGRGSFWRSDAIKMIGFDHRTIAEDHDAMFRAKAYYGFTGGGSSSALRLLSSLLFPFKSQQGAPPF